VSAVAEGALATGSVLVGKYRIESVLGQGGMGLVYRAQHLQLAETVAIKVLRRDAALDREATQRFLREAQLAAKLKSQHVARVTDVGTLEDGLPYMVMEFLAGGDLGQMVDLNGAMHVPVAADLVLQACDALAEAHSLGIVHRDIKPSNLFLSMRPDQSVSIKVLDFGISKSVSGADLSLTQTASVLGTPAYMSPEQMRSARSVDVRTDVWSIGTVLYELVEGRQPFQAESFSEMCVMVAVDPPAPMQLAPELGPIIERCLAKNPEDRYPTVADFMRDLAMFAANQEAARGYVTRAYRTLGLPVPAGRDSTPLPRPKAVARPASAPVTATAPAATSAPTMQTQNQAPSGSRRGLMIGLVAVIAGLIGGVAILKSGGAQPAATDNLVEDTTGSSAIDVGTQPAGSASVAGTAAGSSAVEAVDAGTAVDSGSAIAETGAGSANITDTGSKPTTKPTTRPTRPTTKPVTKHVTKPTTHATTPPPPPNTGSTQTKKPCDPFGSRTGCQ
jgi:serine/threonine-protein kinase